MTAALKPFASEAVSYRVVFFFLILLVLSQTSFAQTITVTDDNNQTITLEQPAQRIISLAPSMTELLFAAGAGDRIIGTSEYSDYPPEAGQIPIIGRYDLINMEAIVALNPDLIVAWRSGNPRAAVQRLIDLGFNVYVAEPTILTSIPDHIDRFATLAGTEQTGNATSGHFRERLSVLESEFSNRKKVTVFYQVWNEPLISVGGYELINDIITLCGGSNIFADLGLAPKISEEAVLQRDPQAIIASGMDISRPEWLDDWLRWPQLKAVSNGDLYFIPPDLVQRHSLRVLSGAEQMCEHIDATRRSAAQ